jgi:hypothetical protein
MYQMTKDGFSSLCLIEKQFESREHVLNWIISNQLGRRNLTDAQKMYLRGKRYEMEKKLRGGARGNQYTKVANPTNMDLPSQSKYSTSARIGKEYGVSHYAIETDEKFSKAIDAMPPETKEKILSGEEKVSKNDMMEFTRLERPIQKKVVAEIKNGTSVSDAIKKSNPDYQNPAEAVSMHCKSGNIEKRYIAHAISQKVYRVRLNLMPPILALSLCFFSSANFGDTPNVYEFGQLNFELSSYSF